MKKYIYILLTTMFFISCSNKLDLPSQMGLDAEKELAKSDVDKLVNAALQKALNPNGVAFITTLYSEFFSDNLELVKGQWFQVTNAFHHEVQEDDILNGYVYPGYYNAIKAANTILTSPASTDTHKAFAKYCRAYNYLRLVELYKEVPIVDENYSIEPIKRSKTENIYAFIIEDLKFAQEHAPAFEPTVELSNIRPTKEAATALLARVYRLSGNIKAAGIEAEKIITSGKYSLANEIKKSESEVIMHFASLEGVGTGEWGYILSWEANAWNCAAVSKKVTDLITPEDTRRAWYDFEEAAGRNGYIFTNMYKTDSNSELWVSRLGEMYLISAEAGNANRLTELQAKRKSTLTLEQERRIELACQFVRWGDMRLSGEANYIVPIPKKSKDSNPLLLEDPI